MTVMPMTLTVIIVVIVILLMVPIVTMADRDDELNTGPCIGTVV